MDKNKMRVLVGCEESQAVTIAFRNLGHEAYSCDIQDCSGGHPEWHIKKDIVKTLYTYGLWDLIILHPDCTAMSLSGNKWYGVGKPYHQKRLDAIYWTTALWDLAKNKSSKVVLENPTSVIFQHLFSPVQYIQPYQFGHMEQKKTGLALHGVQPLVETDNVYEKMMILPKKEREKIWYMPPSADRKKNRSKTYRGIAEAMAQQWGN